MNIDKNIKIELNRTELKALWQLLTMVDYLRIFAKNEHLMVNFIMKAVYKRIMNKLLARGWESTKLSLHPGEASALLIAFNLLDTIADDNVYALTLITKITGIINQKLS